MDELWELPDGWQWFRLSDVTDFPERGEPSRKFGGTFRYLDVSGIEGGVPSSKVVAAANAPSRARQFLQTNDTVISGVRVYLRNFALIEEGGPEVASTAFCVLRPRHELDPRYLFHWVTSDQFINRLLPLQRGNSPPAVLDADLRNQPIPVPSLAVQKEVVTRVGELLAEIKEGERALVEAREGLNTYHASLLNAAVTGKLTAEWRRKNPPLETGADLRRRILTDRRRSTIRSAARHSGSEFIDSRSINKLPMLPDEWAWATLPELGEFGRGKSKHRPRNAPHLYGGPYPFVQTGVIAASGGKIVRHEQNYSDVGLRQSKLWPSGTVCITIAANIAMSGILQFDACFPDSVVGLSCHEGVVPEYIELFIRTIRENLERFAPATAQKNINLETLYAVNVPLPPTQEQRQIIRIINDDSGIGDAVHFDELIERTNALRQSVLSAAFQGELL